MTTLTYIGKAAPTPSPLAIGAPLNGSVYRPAGGRLIPVTCRAAINLTTTSAAPQFFWGAG